MNLSNLDDITYDQALFTKNDIYRKMKNLMNKDDIYRLMSLNDIFVWSKVYHNDSNITGSVVDFCDLQCVNDIKYLTIYRLYEAMATDLMIFTGLNELIWNKLNIPIDINNLNTTSLLDIPSHIDLTQECDDDEDEADDEGEPFEPFEMNLEPLCGWLNDPIEPLGTPEPLAPMPLRTPEPLRTPSVPIDHNFNYDYSVHDVKDKDKVFVEEIPEQCRVDPYDGGWYNKNEFLEYYGGLTEWTNQHPKYVLRREQYCYFAHMFDHLSDKRFMFLFKKYDRTFS